MYIDYSKLWQMLAKKNITKSDLCKLTGISSRVMAKLVKCETVTTDTVARICDALDCDVGDIMEYKQGCDMSPFERYKRQGKVTTESELYKTVTFEDCERKYVVHVTKKSAGKATHIHCRTDGTVYWEQLYPIGGLCVPTREEWVLIKPRREGAECVIVLVRGKPAIITGLDEGIFISSKNHERTKNDVYVMSEAAFKLFKGR